MVPFFVFLFFIINHSIIKLCRFPPFFFFPKTFFILKKAMAPDSARFLLDSCIQTGQDLSTQMIFKTRYLASVNFKIYFCLLSENF